ncbi:branched-chain amino acid ABC transporter permease [Halosimplex aquaticum]|uniref:Branched-chain amino acid ABC transporter permease n=1 Tax=Halosimplex aquaticum TaxID=3026162 RepID=A0ABD5Y0D1_9EURY|nr:branched-chain amino acid ABC transporter permease [Halosimplex aquaticum]
MSIVGDLIVLLVNGLQTGAIYVLLAIGLSIILGTLKFVNFAHGALYVVGAYVGLLVTQQITISNGKLAEWGFPTLGLEWGFFAALVVVPLFVFVVGLAMERFVARPFYDRPDTDQILVTFGLAIVVQELIHALIGPRTYSYEIPSEAFGLLPLSGPVAVPLSAVTINVWRVWVIAITAALVIAVYAVVEYTDFGLVVKAGTRDPEMVRLLGIRITRPYLVMFGIGAALAGLAGVVGGPLQNVNPDIGMTILVPAFLTVVIGGVGSIRGAVLGGTLIGMVQVALISAGTIPIGGFQLNLSPWSQVGIYVLAVIVLLTRPQGLLGSEEVST